MQLMQLEQLLPVTERPDGPIAQHEDQDNWKDDAQRYILIPPPLQKVTYMSQMTNEVATRPYNSERRDECCPSITQNGRHSARGERPDFKTQLPSAVGDSFIHSYSR